MRTSISFLFTARVLVAFALFTVTSEQVSKQYDPSFLDLSQIAKEGTQVLKGEKCSSKDISIAQEQIGIAYNGIPIFSVQITNQCAKKCEISNIHVSCGKFTSATLVNPKRFKRLQYNDCLVNDGQPMKFGTTISFTYRTNFKFPLAVTSLTC